MEKITKYFKHDYENDTTIEYVNTGLYSMLNCSFTSEDPNYGTDTIHYTANLVESMEKLAYDMLYEVKDFLDYREGSVEAPRCDVQNDYGDYSNSTLYAIEKALHDISKDYHPGKWYMTVLDASWFMATKMMEDRTASFGFCEVNADEAKGNPMDHDPMSGGWYGVKRIDGFFDNDPDEFIVAVGYFGGGSVELAYADNEMADRATCAQKLMKAICRATGEGANCWLYVEQDEKKEGN